LADTTLTLLIYALSFLLVILIPITYDTYEAYRERRQLIESLFGKQAESKDAPLTKAIAAAATPGTTLPKDLSDTIDKLLESPEGLPGLGRIVMTMGALAIIAVAMIQLLISATAPPSISSTITPGSGAYNETLALVSQTTSTELDVVKSLVTILGGAVSAMIGFYFGAKSAGSGGTADGSGQNQPRTQTTPEGTGTTTTVPTTPPTKPDKKTNPSPPDNPEKTTSPNPPDSVSHGQ